MIVDGTAVGRWRVTLRDRLRLLWDTVVLVILASVVIGGLVLLADIPYIFGARAVSAGTIQTRQVIPAYKFTSCQTVGVAPVCTTVKQPTRYEFKLEDAAGQTGTVDVTARVYASYRVGQFYAVRN